MKAKKKRLGNKPQIRAVKEHKTRISKTTFLTLILVGAVSAYIIYSVVNRSSNQAINLPFQFKAAIIDHLSLSASNQTFIDTATNILKQAGFTVVDYYSGDKIDVPFYGNFRTRDYGLVLLRVHAAGHFRLGSIELALFTSEPYSQKYPQLQLNEEVGRVSFAGTEPYYFGISHKFVRNSMDRFGNSIVIMMGCDGLNGTEMAQAFIYKGASVYIGWTRGVQASHTDTATIYLLQNLLLNKQTIEQAVDNTMATVGPDPVDKSILSYYPHTLEVGNQTIDIIAGNQTAKP